MDELKPLWMDKVYAHAVRNGCDIFYGVYGYSELVTVFLDSLESCVNDLQVKNVVRQYRIMRQVILRDNSHVPPMEISDEANMDD